MKILMYLTTLQLKFQKQVKR